MEISNLLLLSIDYFLLPTLSGVFKRIDLYVFYVLDYCSVWAWYIRIQFTFIRYNKTVGCYNLTAVFRSWTFFVFHLSYTVLCFVRFYPTLSRGNVYSIHTFLFFESTIYLYDVQKMIFSIQSIKNIFIIGIMLPKSNTSKFYLGPLMSHKGMQRAYSSPDVGY